MQDDGPARPARLARVSVRSSAINGERVTLSGDDGAFVVDNLPPGSYQVYVTKPAYLPMYYGATRPARGPGTNVVVDGRKPVAGVKIMLTARRRCHWNVFDIEGQPAPNVRVQMMTVQTVDGERVLANVSFPGTTLTDDRGMFRVYGVRSGTYVMLAKSTNEHEHRDPPVVGAGNARGHCRGRNRHQGFRHAFGSDHCAWSAWRTAGAGLAGRRGQLFAGVLSGTVSEQDASAFVVTAGQETGNINIRMSLVPGRAHRGRRARCRRAIDDRHTAGDPPACQQFFAVHAVGPHVRCWPLPGSWRGAWRLRPFGALHAATSPSAGRRASVRAIAGILGA
jgi:hypothetical protein